jgi:Ca2+-dependent lipid-binding protein
MDHQMILDTFSHTKQTSITTFRTILGIAILALGCTLPVSSLVFAAELFPYAPSSPSQQGSVEQQPTAKPQFSLEDKAEIRTFNHSWHSGNATVYTDLCETLKGDLDRTVFPTRKLDGNDKL